MLVCLMVLALAQEPAPQTDERAPVRQWLIEQYQEADQLIVEYEKDLQRMAEPPEPMLGLRLEIREFGGDPPSRSTVVTGVLLGSAAQEAGIREGDLLLRIGNEELDHETGRAVLFYLSNYEDEVRLAVQRGKNTEYFYVDLRRAVIPCLAKARRTFESARWHGRFEKLRQMLAGHAAHLPELETQEGFEAAYQNLKTGSELGAKMLEHIAMERALATATACVPASTP